MVATPILRASLDDAYDAAQQSRRALRDQMRAYETTARTAVANGSLSHVGMSSRSTGFSNYGAGQITQEQWVEAWRHLIDTFDTRLADIQCWQARQVPPVTTPVTDLQVKTAMLKCDLVACTEAYPDFTVIDLPRPTPLNREVVAGGYAW